MSKFRTDHTIPPEFPDILKDFVREILRNQPENIYQFGVRYFEGKAGGGTGAGAGAGAGAGGAGMGAMDEEALLEYLQKIFYAADENEDGILDRNEFKNLMQEADLGLSKNEISLLYRDADMDESGSLEIQEFIPLMFDVVKTIMAVKEVEKSEEEKGEEADKIAEEYMLRGVSKAELEQTLRQSFKEADEDDSGQLDINEFRQFLQSTPLNLTRKEINMLYMEVDADENGSVTFEEFIPLFHTLMFELVRSQAMSILRKDEVQNLPQILMHCCQRYDPEQSGWIPPKLLAKAIRDADMGLSHFQILSLVGDSRREEEGVKYETFIEEHAAPLIAKLVDFDPHVSTTQAVISEEQLQAAEREAEEALGMTREEFTKILSEVFDTYDKDGSGFLDPQEFEDALLNSGLNISERQLSMLLAAADENDDGKVSYAEFSQVAVQLIIWAEREAVLQGQAGGGEEQVEGEEEEGGEAQEESGEMEEPPSYEEDEPSQEEAEAA